MALHLFEIRPQNTIASIKVVENGVNASDTHGKNWVVPTGTWLVPRCFLPCVCAAAVLPGQIRCRWALIETPVEPTATGRQVMGVPGEHHHQRPELFTRRVGRGFLGTAR